MEAFWSIAGTATRSYYLLWCQQWGKVVVAGMEEEYGLLRNLKFIVRTLTFTERMGNYPRCEQGMVGPYLHLNRITWFILQPVNQDRRALRWDNRRPDL
jgi:hypothetical protein